MPPAGKKHILSQLEGNQIRLVLPLRTDTADQVAVQRHLQFILVNAGRGITEYAVTFPIGSQHIRQAPLLQLGDILQTDLFGRTADRLVIFVEDRDKIIHQHLPLLVHHPAVHVQLHFQHFIKGSVDTLVLQQRIPLKQGFIILYQRMQIRLVLLRNNHIKKAATFFAPALYQFRIGWRNHH